MVLQKVFFSLFFNIKIKFATVSFSGWSLFVVDVCMTFWPFSTHFFFCSAINSKLDKIFSVLSKFFRDFFFSLSSNWFYNDLSLDIYIHCIEMQKKKCGYKSLKVFYLTWVHENGNACTKYISTCLYFPLYSKNGNRNTNFHPHVLMWRHWLINIINLSCAKQMLFRFSLLKVKKKSLPPPPECICRRIKKEFKWNLNDNFTEPQSKQIPFRTLILFVLLGVCMCVCFLLHINVIRWQWYVYFVLFMSVTISPHFCMHKNLLFPLPIVTCLCKKIREKTWMKFRTTCRKWNGVSFAKEIRLRRKRREKTFPNMIWNISLISCQMWMKQSNSSILGVKGKTWRT